MQHTLQMPEQTEPSEPVSVTVSRAARALAALAAKPSDARLAAQAAAFAEPLAAIADSMTAANEKRRRNAKGGNGRPPVGFALVHERAGTWILWGLEAATAAFNQVTELAVTQGTVANGMARSGSYERVVDTADGSYAVGVRRATPDEEAQHAELMKQPDYAPRPLPLPAKRAPFKKPMPRRAE